MNSKLLTFALAGLAANALPEEDRVMSLPNMATFDTWGFFSGYLPLLNSGKRLHYVFAES
jgi:hypothetical protein